jgi:sulfur-oxidizing protein SoxY
MRILSRRDALIKGTGAAVVLLAGARTSHGTPADAVVAEIAKFSGGKAAEKGMIRIDLPEIAENGNAVPISIAVESPMTADDYVTELVVVADGNPWPVVAKFHFTPLSGRAEAATRIRLASSQNVIAVAKTSDGRLFTSQREIKITIGGCGG